MQYLNCAVTSELLQQKNISLEQYDVDMVTALPDKSGRYLLCTVQSYHTQQLSGVDHYDCIAPLHFSAGYLEYEGQLATTYHQSIATLPQPFQWTLVNF